MTVYTPLIIYTNSFIVKVNIVTTNRELHHHTNSHRIKKAILSNSITQFTTMIGNVKNLSTTGV